MSRLSSALLAGGGFGVAIAGIAAIAGAFKEMYDEAEKAREEMEKQQFESAKEGIDSYRESVERLAGSLEEAAKSHKDFYATLNKIENIGTSIAATEALIEGEKGGTDESRAQGKIKATRLQGEQSVKNAEKAKGDAHRDWQDADKLHNAQLKAIKSLEMSATGWKTRADAYFKEHDGDWDEDSQKKYSDMRLHQSHAEDELQKAKDKELKLRNEVLNKYNRWVASDAAIEEAKKKANLANIRAENDLAELKKKEKEKEEKAQQKKEEQAKRKQEQEQKKKEAEEKRAQEKAHREEVNAKKTQIRKDARTQERDLRDQFAKDMKRLNEEIKDAKEQLKEAIDKERRAFDAAEAAADGGVYNPNGATPGRPRGNVGPESNNTDNANGGAFAQSKSFLPNWAASHPEQARALGMEPGLSKKDQANKARLMDKMANGGYDSLGESDKKLWDDIKSRDPEEKAKQAEKEREKKEQELKAKEAEKEQKRETMYSNIQFIRDNMEEALGKVK